MERIANQPAPRTERILELYRRLPAISLDAPRDFANSASSAIREVFDLIAVSFYINCAESTVLRLKAQAGLDYRGFESFELSMDTVAGRVVTKNQTLIEPQLARVDGYRDSAHLRKLGLNSVVAVPVHSSDEAVRHFPIPMGVLCLYPSSAQGLDELAHEIDQVIPFISRMYLASLQSFTMNLRREVVQRAAYSTDVGSLVHRCLGVLQTEINVEAASIFLVEPRTGFLRMRGTTGLATDKRKEEVFYPPDSHLETYQALMKAEPTLIIDASSAFEPTEDLERLSSPAKSCVLMPILQAATRPGDRPRILGILRVFNRVVSQGDIGHVSRFCWEDLYLLQFFTEMVSVLVHLIQRQEAGEYDFERMLHGARSNLVAAHLNLELLEQRANLEQKLAPELRYTVSNSIAFLSDIRAQLDRSELRHREKLPTERLNLYGDVLSKIPAMVKRMAQAAEAGRFEVTRLDKAGFGSLPPVRGNRDALFCIFRNLAENSVKYCDRKATTHRLDFEAMQIDDCLRVRVSDNGIGIPENEAPYIFVESFRASNAISRHPYSLGRGLSDCREIATKMNAELRRVPSDGTGAVFELDIPLWR